jgi:hypothetical protein
MEVQPLRSLDADTGHYLQRHVKCHHRSTVFQGWDERQDCQLDVQLLPTLRSLGTL